MKMKGFGLSASSIPNSLFPFTHWPQQISFYFFLPSVAARKEVTIPMKPELEIVLGEKRWINTVVAKDIKVGEDFDLFCNVTMDVGHVAQINWLKNVRRSNHPQK